MRDGIAVVGPDGMQWCEATTRMDPYLQLFTVALCTKMRCISRGVDGSNQSLVPSRYCSEQTPNVLGEGKADCGNHTGTGARRLRMNSVLMH